MPERKDYKPWLEPIVGSGGRLPRGGYTDWNPRDTSLDLPSFGDPDYGRKMDEVQGRYQAQQQAKRAAAPPPWDEFYNYFLTQAKAPDVVIRYNTAKKTLKPSEEGQAQQLDTEWLEKAKKVYDEVYGPGESGRAILRRLPGALGKLTGTAFLPGAALGPAISRVLEPSQGWETISPVEAATTALDIGYAGQLAKPLVKAAGKTVAETAPKLAEQAGSLAKKLEKQPGFASLGGLPEEPLLNPAEYQAKYTAQKVIDLTQTAEGQAKLTAGAKPFVEAQTKRFATHQEAVQFAREQGKSIEEALNFAKAALKTGELPKSSVVQKLLPGKLWADFKNGVLESLEKEGYSNLELEAARTQLERFGTTGRISEGVGSEGRTSVKTILKVGLKDKAAKFEEFVQKADELKPSKFGKPSPPTMPTYPPDIAPAEKLVKSQMSLFPEETLGDYANPVSKEARSLLEEEQAKLVLAEQEELSFATKLREWQPEQGNIELAGSKAGKARYAPFPKETKLGLFEPINTSGEWQEPVARTAQDIINEEWLTEQLANQMGTAQYPAKNLRQVVREIRERGVLGNVKAMTNFDALNILRTIQSSYDVSAPGRQGFLLGLIHPDIAPKAWAGMFKSLASEKEYQKIMTWCKDSLAKVRYDEKVMPFIADIDASLTAREESFMSRIAGKIPGIRPSNRAFNAYLNIIRVHAYTQGADLFMKMGISDMQHYRALAELVNWGTGRGSYIGPLAKLERISPLINGILWSPKLQLSRFEIWSKLFSQTPYVRHEAMKMLVSFLGFGATVIGLARLSGIKVEAAPRSAEFGKIKVGNTRIDVFVGYLQYIRMLSQLTTGSKKTIYGNIVPVSAWDTTLKMMQSKEGPIASLFTSLLQGEDYSGNLMRWKPEEIKTQIYNRMTPLFIQDFMDAVTQEGLAGGLVALPSAFGMGATTYSDPVGKLKDEAAKKLYNKTYAELGLDSNDQLKIDNLPQIVAAQELSTQKYQETVTGKRDPTVQYWADIDSFENKRLKDIQVKVAEFRQTGDGKKFRESIQAVEDNRRSAYDAINLNPLYKDISERLNNPTPETLAQMNPKDIQRLEYNKLMYGPDMTDSKGSYQFDLADERKAAFVAKYGQEALGYIEQRRDIKDKDLPQEYRLLQQAKKILKPYWEIQDQIWAMYPVGTQELSEKINLMAKTQPDQAKVLLRLHPEILRARELVALYHKKMRQENPVMDIAFRMFYQ